MLFLTLGMHYQLSKLTAGLLLLLWFFTACNTGVTPEEWPEPEYAGVYASLPSGTLATPATPFNKLFTRYGNGWTGGDAVYSVPLPDGSIIWAFGDSFLDTVYPDRSRPPSPLIRNTMMLQQGKNMTTLHGGTTEESAAMVDTEDPDNEWYWPLDGTVQDGILYMFYAYFIRTGGGAWDFQYVRTELVAFQLYDFTILSQETVWEAPGIIFGVAIMKTDDYIYIYSTDDEPWTKHAHCARVPADNFLSPWEFYDGAGGWSATFPGEAGWMTKGSGDNGVDVAASFSVFYHEGRYRLLTQEGFLGPDIHSYESLEPFGPWKGKQLVYTTPEAGGSLFTYNALLHPHITKPGTSAMLVSYCVNTNNFFELFSNADVYRPYFFWLDYMD